MIPIIGPLIELFSKLLGAIPYFDKWFSSKKTTQDKIDDAQKIIDEEEDKFKKEGGRE